MHGRRRCNFLRKRRRALSDRPNVLHFDLKEEKSERSYHLSFLFFLVKIGVCSVGHFCARRSSTSFPGEGLCGGYSRATFRAPKVALHFEKTLLGFLTKKKTEIDWLTITLFSSLNWENERLKEGAKARTRRTPKSFFSRPKSFFAFFSLVTSSPLFKWCVCWKLMLTFRWGRQEHARA